MNDFAINVLTAALGKTHLFSVGQAGYIIKSKNGQLLGYDLYLSECVERVEGHIGFKRLLPKILSPFELNFDCVVASHPHFDHFDMDAIPQLMSNKKTKLFASVDCEKEIKRLEMKNDLIQYVKPGETYNLGDFHIRFVNCDHGAGAPDAVGAVITVDGKRIFFAGDTCLRLDLVDEFLEDGPIDVMISPINGAFGNLNEQECVELCKAVNPEITIPSHYGMFASHGGDVGKFYTLMTEQCSDKKFVLMAMGEAIQI